ncbi:hypothetical protein QAD02_021477 [Eretmocerus hayati]|uniref:Uncharacterized protein n=1 Tax=Eretmocerus hayati TaxID=131215 RepID=A0ACC2PSW0_9HYME|nr:hypothetical protein QAD02_021477 [Eretmocerus hayati]
MVKRRRVEDSASISHECPQSGSTPNDADNRSERLSKDLSNLSQSSSISQSLHSSQRSVLSQNFSPSQSLSQSQTPKRSHHPPDTTPKRSSPRMTPRRLRRESPKITPKQSGHTSPRKTPRRSKRVLPRKLVRDVPQHERLNLIDEFYSNCEYALYCVYLKTIGCIHYINFQLQSRNPDHFSNNRKQHSWDTSYYITTQSPASYCANV